MIWLAFYKGHGRLTDRLIRWASQSPFSHVELVLEGHACENTLNAISASGRDGGVRVKAIAFHPDRWVFVPVPWADRQSANARAMATVGAGYDWTALFLAQVLHLRRTRQDLWFCSELVAHALGLPQPQTLSPGDLYLWVRAMNDLHAQSTCAKHEDQNHA